jgi:hypothetical protein
MRGFLVFFIEDATVYIQEAAIIIAIIGNAAAVSGEAALLRPLQNERKAGVNDI